NALGKQPFEDVDALEQFDLAEQRRPESEREPDMFLRESVRILSDYIYFSRLYQDADNNNLAKQLDIRLGN
ncbi:MAG: hypothetical protein OXI10_03090, partial [Gammaproteobacteria bacterium]|nr:hypothetical protein [Gammaproteobacteria bacterium]